MNLNALINRKSISKVLLSAVLLSIFPVITGSTPAANAANLSTTQAATACASSVSDSSTAKLDVRIDGNYCVLSFLAGTNTWMPPTGVTQIEYLVVAGGGGGGGNRGGGGGAGGFVTATETVTSQVAISVGAGGAGGVNSVKGTNGSDSTLTYTGKNIQAIGGGAGGAPFVGSNVSSAGSGGSGGGSGTFASSGTSNTDIGSPGGSGTASQGYAGGSTAGKSGNDGTDSSYSWKSACTQTWDLIRNSAGGGGAGGKGISGRGGSISNPATTLTCVSSVTPDGGPGRSSSITGTARTYAGGGGGAAGRFNKNDTENNNYYTAGPGNGGSGIGGAGSPIIGTVGGAGAPNTGSGGGGGGNSWTSASDKGACGSDNDEACDGGAGGSGIVIIRFQKYFDNALECITGVSDTSTSVLEYSTFNGDCILKFSTPSATSAGTNTWIIPQKLSSIWILAVGAGGGGGSNEGGGGGGGQVQESKTASVTPGGTLNIRIGKGGTNTGNALSPGFNGGLTGESTTALGGGISLNSLGGGGAVARNAPVTNGWTGGGCVTGTSVCSAAVNYPVGGSNFRGGNGFANSNANAGGGGGAGGVGQDGGNGNGGEGGIGFTSTITGSALCLGGGGGGGAWSYDANPNTPGKGSCGGADGTNTRSGTSDAAVDTGGGGGGGGGGQNTGTPANSANGGRGGTGLLIIRFALPTSNKATQNLNMACHSYATPTGTTDAVTAGYFGTPFTTDTQTTDFAFPTASGNDVSQDWGESGPAGCSTSGNYYTLYISGYIQWTGSSETVWFAMNSDDGAQLMIDGSTRVEAVSDRGFGNGIYAAPNGMSLTRNSWHYIQIWLHENTGAAALNLYWQAGSTARPDSWTLVPRANISRTVPRTLNFDTSTVSSGVLSATVDTSTSVRGGPNATSTLMSSGGTFAFYESGTAIAGCSSVVAVKGVAQCDLGSIPSAGTRKYYRVTFTPETSTASTDIQHNVFALTQATEEVMLGKVRNAKLFIGQYDAFPGISTYPLNVYGDGTIYGALTRTLTDTGTAGCALDATKFFLTAAKVGTCSVSVNAAGDVSHYSETTTATIYWIEFKNNFVTQVPSTPTQIALSGQVQIIRHSYDTLTVTGFKNADGSSVITSAAIDQTIRIYGTGFLSSDDYGVVHLGGNTDLYRFNSEFSVNTSDPSANYIQLTIPSGTATDKVGVEFTNKGVVYSTDVLTITS